MSLIIKTILKLFSEDHNIHTHNWRYKKTARYSSYTGLFFAATKRIYCCTECDFVLHIYQENKGGIRGTGGLDTLNVDWYYPGLLWGSASQYPYDDEVILTCDEGKMIRALK